MPQKRKIMSDPEYERAYKRAHPPPKERPRVKKFKPENDTLFYRASKVVAKNAKTNDLSGLPLSEKNKEKAEYRINKKAYDKQTKKGKGEQLKKLQKTGEWRKDYKNLRHNFVTDPDNKEALNLSLKK